MQATQAWCALIERIATLKREFWFTLIRVTIVVALIGTAARLIAIAFAPQPSAVPQQLDCPPDVVTHDKTPVPPQVLAVTEQSATSVANGDEIANKPDVQAMIGKKQGDRSGAKKPPPYVPARNSVSLKRAAMSEPAKRGKIDANQPQNRTAPMPTPDFGILQSAFHDMHGQ